MRWASSFPSKVDRMRARADPLNPEVSLRILIVVLLHQSAVGGGIVSLRGLFLAHRSFGYGFFRVLPRTRAVASSRLPEMMADAQLLGMRSWGSL